MPDQRASSPAGTPRHSSVFDRAAQWTARQSGRASTFIGAVGIVVVWVVSGPVFGYSDTWQLVINTGTTIVTFLMVFLIQNSQNRDMEALQLKLDELIRASREARNRLLNLEDLSEEELNRIKQQFLALAADGGAAAGGAVGGGAMGGGAMGGEGAGAGLSGS